MSVDGSEDQNTPLASEGDSDPDDVNSQNPTDDPTYEVEGVDPIEGVLPKDTTLLQNMMIGRGPDGVPLGPGKHKFKGMSVTIPGGKTKTVKDKDVLKFKKGKRGRALKGDNYTKRAKDGSIIPLTDKTRTAMSAHLEKMVDTKGNLWITDKKDRDSMAKLIELLSEINGQDAYSNETQALGKLNPNEFLLLPSDMATPQVAAADVGSAKALEQFSTSYVLAVYALNKTVCKDPRDAIKFAAVRMEAVKCGWVAAQREIRYVPTPADFLTTAMADANELAAILLDAAKVAYLVPMAAEHVFRTAGHHFFSNIGADYIAKYAQILKACLEPNIEKFMSPNILYHQALHWISPGRIWAVLQAAKGDNKIPEAIQLRMTAAPAGTTIITTTMAIVEAMSGMGIYEKLRDYKIADVDLLKTMSSKIKSDPVRYHKVPQAYDLPHLTGNDLLDLERAKGEAIKLAPVCKAYVDVMLRRSVISNQQVLNKHATNNPMVYAIAKKLFLVFSKETLTIETLFLATAAAVNKDED